MALVILMAAGAVSILISGSSDAESAAARAEALAPSYVADRPRDAAHLALAGDLLEPSVTSQLSMLSVAIDSAGVERILVGGGDNVTAAIRTSHLVVTCDERGVLRVWRPYNGALLGETRIDNPVVAFADSWAAPVLAATDASGRLSLIDISDPAHPDAQQLPAKAGNGSAPLAMALGDEGATILTVSQSGEVEEFDTMTGQALGRWQLREVSGATPLSGGNRRLQIVAAAFDSQTYGTTDRLLVGLSSGAVVRVELKPKRGRTMIPAGYAPGRITSVAELPFGHEVAAGAAGGYMTSQSGEQEPTVRRGPRVAGVAFDVGETLWIADQEGTRSLSSLDRGIATPPAGGPVKALSPGLGGPVAIDPHGVVGLTGVSTRGLALPPTTATTIASFDPEGRLLIEEGAPGSVYRLVTLMPGHGTEYGQEVANPEVRAYEPDSDWWPEEDSGLVLESGAIDDELVVAGGQDPTGTAVVLVWNAKTGHPLQRLPLTTGAVDTIEPSVVTEVLLLPGKHLLAAYSAVQELIVIWSTDTWEQIAAVPVGPIGSMALSPSESEIVAIGGSEEEEEEEEAGSEGKLVFVDIDRGAVDREVAIPGVTDAAWSPNGDRLAAVDSEGKLRIMSSDGEDEVEAPSQVGPEAFALAWRPDGKELAVSLGESIVIVDPATGGVSPPLPHDPGSYSVVHHLRWSPDGRFLAAAVANPRETEEGYEPGPAQLWTVGEARLRRRMCQLSGGAISPREWRRLVGADSPRPLCRPTRLRSPAYPGSEDAAALSRIDLAFRSGNDLFVSDRQGHVARIGHVQGGIFPQMSVSWSTGALAWASQGRVGLLPFGSSQVVGWPCVCHGAALHHGMLTALGSDGRQLFEFSPDQVRPRSVAIDGKPGFNPRLLGYLGDRIVVTGYETETPDRGTPSTLYLIGPDNRAARLAEDKYGMVAGPFAESPAENVLAFNSILSGGVCYSPSTIGVLRLTGNGRPTLTYPKMPDGNEPQEVRSLLVRRDGAVEAAIAPIGCGDSGTGPSSPPNATHYMLRHGHWSPTRERGFDVQPESSVTALISQPPSLYKRAGTLSLRHPAGGKKVVAKEVEQLWARP